MNRLPGLLLFFGLLLPAPARAEGGLDFGGCSPGSTGFYPMDGASVPAAFMGPLFSASGGGPGVSTSTVRVAQLDAGGVATPLAFTLEAHFTMGGWVVVLGGPLVAGTRLQVSVERCTGVWDTATYDVVADAPLPTSLGPLHATATPWVFVDRSSHTTVHVTLDSPPGPWGEAWQALATLDGVPEGTAGGGGGSLAMFSASSGGVDIVAPTTCPGYSGTGIAPGTYTVRLAAGPYGYATTIETTTTVDVGCPGPFDGGTSEEGGVFMDGGTAMDAELGTHDPGAGCGCRVTRSAGHRWMAALPFGVLFLAWRRRARRRLGARRPERVPWGVRSPH